MRMEIVTNNHMIGLGAGAKKVFIDNVLGIDGNGQCDTLQTFKEDTLDKIKQLPLGAGFTQKIKDGAIKAFEEMQLGEKFLCLNKWVLNYHSDEAKFYWKVQNLCNEGHTFDKASSLAQEWLTNNLKQEKVNTINTQDLENA